MSKDEENVHYIGIAASFVCNEGNNILELRQQIVPLNCSGFDNTNFLL